MDGPLSFDLFRFMALRAPRTPSDKNVYRRYIRDNFIYLLENLYQLSDRDLSADSLIGKKVFDDVFCQKKDSATIISEVLEFAGFGYKVTVGCNDARILGLPNSSQYCFSEKSGNDEVTYYFRFSNSFTEKLDLAAQVIESHLANFDKKLLIRQLQKALGLPDLSAFVFEHIIDEQGRVTASGNTPEFKQIKADLFELLYCLYMAKRRFPVNLEHITRQLQTLHVIEYLGYDDFASDFEEALRRKGCFPLPVWLSKYLYTSQSGTDLQIRRKALAELRKGLYDILPQASDTDLMDFVELGPWVTQPYIKNKADLLALFSAQPIIHSIFARLQHYLVPFNNIRAIGKGDLKIVKQILIGYEMGEIAHVENVLRGENRERIHRRLDTIETFTSDEQELTRENTRNLESTDHMEMQKETQETIKSDLNLNAGVTATYHGPMVEATANVGFAYNRSSEESTRNASNFARDIVNRSAEKITQRTRELRTTRRLSEVEETNRHGIDNKGKDKHVTGIYRYLNKRYKAQVFNYGERVMFEFLIPEPGEFYKMAMLNKRLFSAEAVFNCTRPPVPLPDEITNADQVTKANFTEIGKRYQLTNLAPFPCELEADTPSDPKILTSGRISDQAQFDNIDQNSGMPALNGAEKASLDNTAFLNDKKDSGQKTATVTLKTGCKAVFSIKIFTNTYRRIGGGWPGDTGVISITKGTDTFGPYDVGIMNDKDLDLITVPDFTADSRTEPTVTINVTSSWCRCFYAVIHIHQYPIPELVSSWQQEIHKTIWDKYRTLDAQRTADCATDLATFNDQKKQKEEDSAIVIKGKNPEINKDIIKEELKKHSITLFAKEFDADASDGELLQDKPISYPMERIKKVLGATVDKSKCAEVSETPCHVFPAIDIELARKKGRAVQFLEQAFEWHNISYLLYPYFYAARDKWMENYDHVDNEPGDPLFVNFLRAGYARVLVPVKPSYEGAVTQFLLTRELWNGGDVPVIGDPLFLPLYEEVRNQTDEYQGASPDGKPWEYVLPTSLIYLQENADLPVFNNSFPVSPST
ncbi:MAG: hypothetical protein JNK77_12895 [Saprospiraceae bacterium]|nr:hypothetical protein [Saprospiraceae bacterium]